MASLSLILLQWFLVFLYFMSACVKATDQNVMTVKDAQGNTVNVKYEAVGCFRDEKPNRALSELYFNARSMIDWNRYPDFTYIVRACVENAYKQGFKTVLGVQYYGECWSDDSPEGKYAKYGKSSNCEHGVGKELANKIYRLSETCNINGKEYSEGAEMSIPNDWSSDIPNAKCMKCKCTSGQAKDCKDLYYCETGRVLCSKWKNVTGECCPVCDCYNNGHEMAAKSTWVVREGDSCSECTCGDNKVATCTPKMKCGVCLGESIPVPGKCCPKCVAKTTTAPTPEIIPITTERPPPTFPPFPSF